MNTALPFQLPDRMVLLTAKNPLKAGFEMTMSEERFDDWR